MYNRNYLLNSSVAIMRKRLNLIVWPCAVFLLACSMGSFVFAQPVSKVPNVAVAKSDVSVELIQRKVIKGVDGKEQLVDATIVKPGDVLEYRAIYTNNSTKTVTNLIGELPIPLGLEYQRRSARPGAAQVKVATQEGDFAAEPLMRKFGAVQKEVPYSEYRMLRWTLGQLLAGAKTTVSARASVETYVASSSGVLAPTPPVPVVSAPTTVKP